MSNLEKADFENDERSWQMFIRHIPLRFRRRLSGGVYRAEIDGLRFLAIAIVVIGHFAERSLKFFPFAHDQAQDSIVAKLLQRPGLGVYLFFTISGFILTSQALRSRKNPLSLAFIRPYFSRRVMRIEPPYIILLCSTWILISLVGYSPERATHFDAMPQSLNVSLFSSIFYMHDLLWGNFPRLFPPGWSLEIEVQFYILAPFLFWLYFRLNSKINRIIAGVAVLCMSAIISLNAPDRIGSLHTDHSIIQFFHYFWLGILLAGSNNWIVAKANSLSPLVTTSLGWGALAIYLVIPAAPDTLFLGFTARALAVATIAAMFVSVSSEKSGFRSFCTAPWISLIGSACYSIYLTHIQVIQVLTSITAKIAPASPVSVLLILFVLEVLAVLFVGLSFYVFIERPFMDSALVVRDVRAFVSTRKLTLRRPEAPENSVRRAKAPELD